LNLNLDNKAAFFSAALAPSFFEGITLALLLSIKLIRVYVSYTSNKGIKNKK
jgi:hypothetical protein